MVDKGQRSARNVYFFVCCRDWSSLKFKRIDVFLLVGTTGLFTGPEMCEHLYLPPGRDVNASYKIYICST